MEKLPQIFWSWGCTPRSYTFLLRLLKIYIFQHTVPRLLFGWRLWKTHSAIRMQQSSSRRVRTSIPAIMGHPPVALEAKRKRHYMMNNIFSSMVSSRLTFVPLRLWKWVWEDGHQHTWRQLPVDSRRTQQHGLRENCWGRDHIRDFHEAAARKTRWMVIIIVAKGVWLAWLGLWGTSC